MRRPGSSAECSTAASCCDTIFLPVHLPDASVNSRLQGGKAGRQSKTGSPEVDDGEGSGDDEDADEDMDEDDVDEEEAGGRRPKRAATARTAAARGKKGSTVAKVNKCYVRGADIVQVLLSSEAQRLSISS